MPAVLPSPQTKVLVTGVTGYVAVWLVSVLLKRGYSVRGTVRSLQKGKFLKDKFASYGDKFELVVVKDMAAEGAFDEAVKGVDAVEHLAALVTDTNDDPQAYIQPAVQGTTGILKSILKHGSSIKRVVITSSCATVAVSGKAPKIFDDSDWNDYSVKIVEEIGRAAPNLEKYRASKVLSERAAWDFYEEHKSTVGWDLVVLNPPFVFGPAAHEVTTAASLNVSLQHFYQTVVLGEMFAKTAETLAIGNSWVDVRDVAAAHALSLEKEAAGGERFIISAGPMVWQDIIDMANSLEPSPIPSYKLGKGIPGTGSNPEENERRYNSTKSVRILGIKYRSMEEMVRDTLADFERRGI
ncbi:D-lactaldehyde dehydrogenase [Mycena floridula]|nr:D-lactaldehyde dehydrogenase [Mycena floridula]